MRRPIIAIAIAGAALAGCATSMENLGYAPWTPMTVAAWNGAPEGPFRAAEGERILTQFLVPSHVVALIEEPRILGVGASLGPSLGVSAGERLFGVVDEDGPNRFCASPVAGEAQLVCFEDEDDDGAFDRAWTAATHPSFPMAIRRWTDRRKLATPVRFTAADPLEGPRQQVAIRYLGRTRDLYGFTLQVGDADDFSDVAWTSRAAWLAPDETGTLTFAGARITVLQAQGDRLTYQLQSAMTGAPLTLQVSTATRTLDSLIALEQPAA